MILPVPVRVRTVHFLPELVPKAVIVICHTTALRKVLSWAKSKNIALSRAMPVKVDGQTFYIESTS